ncbi:MAG TPA: hypothetical protein VGK45_17255 [Thermoanaerobaculia bacterium]
MVVIDDPEVLARAQETFELYELAEVMMRQNLHHRFPRETDAEIERRLTSWLRKEPRWRWDSEVGPPDFPNG